MKRICFYLSDHGFGHIARNIPIIVSVVKNYDTFVYVVLLEEKHLAVSVTQEELHDIEGIIQRLNRLDGSYGKFYDCADEVAEKIMSL